ncbi:MAG: hypothetical protein GVY17_02820 [Cyanobacteria bacterium]|nr:hypothetical protein [Cyanobacteria bacterium GSL.Bin21]
MSEQRLAQIDLESLASWRQYFPSPMAWEDQVFYFLMLDRFSDGNENGYDVLKCIYSTDASQVG